MQGDASIKRTLCPSKPTLYLNNDGYCNQLAEQVCENSSIEIMDIFSKSATSPDFEWIKMSTISVSEL
jgi:hypothetical protein